jgi:hypothetical protein
MGLLTILEASKLILIVVLRKLLPVILSTSAQSLVDLGLIKPFVKNMLIKGVSHDSIFR